MKTKTFAILFALAMVLSMAVGVFAQDFTETWDENTVLTVFNDFEMVFPDMFADEDSDFIWTDNGPKAFEQYFPGSEPKSVDVAPKAALEESAGYTTMEATYDPCGDGLIKYDVTVTKSAPNSMMPWEDVQGYYYGDKNTTYIRDINAYLTVTPQTGSSSTYKLGVKTCASTGGDDCHSVSFKKKGDAYEAHLKGYLTVPDAIVLENVNAPDSHTKQYDLDMFVNFSTYMTALWPVTDSGTVYASASTVNTTDNTMKANTKKEYCQRSLQVYDQAFGYGAPIRAKYDENTGEARLQVVVRNFEPDVRRQNYVIPAEVYAYNTTTEETDYYLVDDTIYEKTYTKFVENNRVTDYTCKYTIYNVANAAPRTEYCKYGEGIAIPNHGMVRIDLTIDALSGDVLRKADGKNIPLDLRLGGMPGNVSGVFEPVDFPCPVVSRMQVLDPIKPFMTFFKVLKSDGAIKPSGAYGVYEGGLWGMYQKCGKFAYMMVRLKNDGINDEVVNLDHTAVAVNGGTPMKWNWILTTMEPEKGSKIVLAGGEEVTLIGRAKVTDIPSQLNADTAMTGAVNFTDFGFYITGKVYSDHNNTRCVAAPK